MFVLGDFLSCIRNGFMVSKLEVLVKKSKYILSILNVLLQDGYIRGYTIVDNGIIVFLKYNKGVSVISTLKLVSKPTKRIYMNFKELKKYSESNKICYITTSKGILNNKDFFLYKTGLGGEVLFYIK